MRGPQIVELDVSEVDRVEPLFRELVAFHRGVAGEDWPVRSEEAAWAHRRGQYVRWLGDGRARMLVAVADEGEEAGLGYAVLSVKPSSASWDVGERIGELETLAVAEEARGRGVGSLLIDACRERLREEGITHWGVAVSRPTPTRPGCTSGSASAPSTASCWPRSRARPQPAAARPGRFRARRRGRRKRRRRGWRRSPRAVAPSRSARAASG